MSNGPKMIIMLLLGAGLFFLFQTFGPGAAAQVQSVANAPTLTPYIAPTPTPVGYVPTWAWQRVSSHETVDTWGNITWEIDPNNGGARIDKPVNCEGRSLEFLFPNVQCLPFPWSANAEAVAIQIATAQAVAQVAAIQPTQAALLQPVGGEIVIALPTAAGPDSVGAVLIPTQAASIAQPTMVMVIPTGAAPVANGTTGNNQWQYVVGGGGALLVLVIIASIPARIFLNWPVHTDFHGVMEGPLGPRHMKEPATFPRWMYFVYPGLIGKGDPHRLGINENGLPGVVKAKYAKPNATIAKTWLVFGIILTLLVCGGIYSALWYFRFI